MESEKNMVLDLENPIMRMDEDGDDGDWEEDESEEDDDDWSDDEDGDEEDDGGGDSDE